MEDQETLKCKIAKRIKGLQFMCLFMFISDPTLLLVAWLLTSQRKMNFAESIGGFAIAPPMLMAIGAAIIVLSWPFKALLLGKLKMPGKYSLKEVMAKYSSATLCAVSLREAIVLFGFISTLLTYDMSWVTWGFIAGVLTKLEAFPRTKHLEKYFSVSQLKQSEEESNSTETL